MHTLRSTLLGLTVLAVWACGGERAQETQPAAEGTQPISQEALSMEISADFPFESHYIEVHGSNPTDGEAR